MNMPSDRADNGAAPNRNRGAASWFVFTSIGTARYSRLILSAGFGGLLLLIMFAGADGMQTLRRTIQRVNERYLR